MSTRRSVLTVGAAAAVLAACGEPLRGSGGRVPSDLLQVQTTAGLSALKTTSGRPTAGPATAVATPDGRRLAGVTAAGQGAGQSTQLRIFDTIAGSVVQAATLRGRLVPRTVSADGQLVALVEGGATDVHRPVGRSRTTIVVAGAAGERYRLTLPGCVEPEAFSPSGERLFVLDYLPPAQPERYRVRALDLATGRLGPLNLPNVPVKTLVPSGAEEEMRGQGRQAVYHPSSERLFTLYTHQPDHQHVRDRLAGARAGRPDVHAFVHTLSVRDGWAYCIDMPAPFGTGLPEANVIAGTRSGTDLYVVDAGMGAVARIDPSGMFLTMEARFQPVPGDAAALTVSVDGRRLYLAKGKTLTVFDTGSLRVLVTLPLPAVASGVAASPTRLYVGQPGHVAVLDPGTGAIVRSVPAPSLVRLVGLIG